MSLIGYALTHRIVIYFEGIFQDRLATDPDPSDEKRGLNGWTFAHSGEPNLDRIIRFSNPIVERPCADPVGVKVTRINVDGSDINDVLIGKMVNLGKQNYFDGSQGAGDGFEPIVEFELHIGDDNDYIKAEVQDFPRGTGAVVISEDMQRELGVFDMEEWRRKRTDCLNSITYPPGSEEDIRRKERLEKVLLTGFIRDIRGAVQLFSVRYACIMDKNVLYNPQDSLIVDKIKNLDIKRLFFNADFYSYDGDGLVGHVKGTLSATFTDESII